jgi:hypothetical protein
MSAVQQRFDDTLSRADDLLGERLRREEQELARQDASLEEARRQRQRANAEERRLIAGVYDDAFRSFGTEVPAAVDDEAPAAYRRRLFNRLARKLPSGHDLKDVRADDVSAQPMCSTTSRRWSSKRPSGRARSPRFRESDLLRKLFETVVPALKSKCCPNVPARRIARSVHEAARDKARAIAKTEAYAVSCCERKKVEMLFAHLKRILRLDRLRLRGPSGAKDEFLLAATA